MGKFFQKFGEDMRELQKTLLDYWREETMGEFFKNLEKICANFQKEFWREETMGDFSRNLEKICAKF